MPEEERNEANVEKVLECEKGRRTNGQTNAMRRSTRSAQGKKDAAGTPAGRHREELLGGDGSDLRRAVEIFLELDALDAEARGWEGLGCTSREIAAYYEDYRDEFLGFAYKLAGGFLGRSIPRRPQCEPENLVQEAFTAALATRHTVPRARDRFRRYMYAALRKRFASELTWSFRQMRFCQALEGDDALDACPGRADIFREVCERERRAAIEQAFWSLPPDHAKALRMCIVEGCSESEAGRAVGRDRSRISRWNEWSRKYLASNHGELRDHM